VRKRERIQAALDGEATDKIPCSLWRHFYRQEQSASELAESTLAFYRQFNLDLIKLTPNTLYPLEDWGARIEFSRKDDEPPRLKRPLIREPEDWRNLPAVTDLDGALGRELKAIQLIKEQLTEDDAPLLMTIYSPVTIAHKLAGELVFGHLQQHRADVSFGLATIAETTARFARAALEHGADGVFFSTKLAQGTLLEEKTYRSFGLRYDLIVLEQVQDLDPLLVLHLAGEQIFFNLVDEYPVQIVAWQPWLSAPSLARATSLTTKTLLTGLSPQLLEHGSPNEIQQTVSAVVEATSARRLILSLGSVVPPSVPEQNLLAVVEALNSWPSLV
jgi:uroporphyrinogen decarboxylase